MFYSCGFLVLVLLSKFDFFIEMSKGLCYGCCLVFILIIYENGIVSYKGECYIDWLGIFVRKLEKFEMECILGEFDWVNFWQFCDSYWGCILDMQSVIIFYYQNGKKKMVIGKEIWLNVVKWLEF